MNQPETIASAVKDVCSKVADLIIQSYGSDTLDVNELQDALAVFGAVVASYPLGFLSRGEQRETVIMFVDFISPDEVKITRGAETVSGTMMDFERTLNGWTSRGWVFQYDSVRGLLFLTRPFPVIPSQEEEPRQPDGYSDLKTRMADPSQETPIV